MHGRKGARREESKVAKSVVDFADDELAGAGVGVEQVEAKLNKLVEPYGLTGRVRQLNGPGGGWPEVELEGEREALAKALRAEWDYDEDDLADLGLQLITD